MNIHIDTDAVWLLLVVVGGCFAIVFLYRKWRSWVFRRDLKRLTDLVGIKSPFDED